MEQRLVTFGLGYTGEIFCRRLRAQGWSVDAILREDGQRLPVQDLEIRSIDVAATDRIQSAVSECEAILVVSPPSQGRCPALDVLSATLSQARGGPRWIGYLSSTSVYGDQEGAWTDEDSPLRGTSTEGKNRIQAERAWLDFCAGFDLPLSVFRLAGIYGPGRSALDRLRQGTARRIEKQDHVLSRIHVDDLVALLDASLRRGTKRGVFNVCDDEPASSVDVVTYAAELLGIQPPPIERFESSVLSPAAARFFKESRRISNALAKRALDWNPRYPSYREGLEALLADESR